MKLTSAQIRSTVAKMRLREEDKAALLKQALEFSDHNALAIIVFHHRKQTAGA